MNRAAFDTYIETQLAPTLQPGDVVIAPSHDIAAQCTAGQWTTCLPTRRPRQKSA